jgi:hypothetical protein
MLAAAYVAWAPGVHLSRVGKVSPRSLGQQSSEDKDSRSAAGDQRETPLPACR